MKIIPKGWGTASCAMSTGEGHRAVPQASLAGARTSLLYITGMNSELYIQLIFFTELCFSYPLS